MTTDNTKCSLNQWLQTNFKEICFDDTKSSISLANTFNLPAKSTRNTVLEHKLTIALLSTNNIEEYTSLAFSYSPVGTIKDGVDTDWYNTKILQLRATLTDMLMTETNHKMAERYLKILERRDSTTWSEKKEKTELSVKNNDLSVTFTIKE